MNLKTTLVLLVLTAAGGALYWFSPALPSDLSRSSEPERPDAGTLGVLKDDLTPARLSRIEVKANNRAEVDLVKSNTGQWALPGRWPIREPEVTQLVKQLSNLRSRFAPIPLEATTDLRPYGLDHAPVQVIVWADNKKYRLSIGEEPANSNSFTRATYVRLADPKDGDWKDRPEVVRLQPGLVAFLDRPLTYYQNRRLFPFERLASEGWPDEETERITGASVAVRLHNQQRGQRLAWLATAGQIPFSDSAFACLVPSLTTYALGGMDQHTLEPFKGDLNWRLKEPVVDRLDKSKLKALLSGGAELWIEEFLPPLPTDPAERQNKLYEYGLTMPEQILTVTPPGGGHPETLLVGKKSTRNKDLRYARLEGNDLVFTVKDSACTGVFVEKDELRNKKLADFKPENVRRITIATGGNVIELDKRGTLISDAGKKDLWQVRKPRDMVADEEKVKPLLDALANLKVEIPKVIDDGKREEYGLNAPAAVVTLTVNDDAGDGTGARERSIRLHFGKKDKAYFVSVDDWPRINPVGDTVAISEDSGPGMPPRERSIPLSLVERSAVDYRGPAVLAFEAKDIARLEVQRGKQEKYVLAQTGGKWRLTAPVDATADPQQIRPMTDALSALQSLKYVTDEPTPEDLDKLYGLAKPELTATIHFENPKQAPITLRIGKPAEGTPGYYAQMSDSPTVFVVARAIQSDLNRDSLAYRPRELWRVAPEDVAAMRVQRQSGPEYQLIRTGDNWKITGPFDAAVGRQQADALAKNLSLLRCEGYEAHTTKDPAAYGFDKPYLKLTLVEKGEPAKEHTLIVGNPSEKAFGARYAKVADEGAVFLIAPILVNTFNADALDLLDRNLLTLSANAIKSISSKVGDSTMTLERKDDGWHVVAGATKFTADPSILENWLAIWANLRTDHFAAYGDKVDLAKYGLDKPTATITITVQANKDAKAEEHTLALGKPAEDEKEAVYARLDNSPGVAVLSPFQAEMMRRTYLDLVDRRLLKLELPLASIERRMGESDLLLARRGNDWSVVKPAEQRGDEKGLTTLARQLGDLRAVRIAAFPAKDSKDFGLTEPAAVLTLKVGDDDKGHVLKIGAAVKDGDSKGDRYVQVDGSSAVGVLAGDLAAKLLAPPVAFRDRVVANYTDADRVTLERNQRHAVFEQIDGTWKLKEPLLADAEQNDLQNFVDSLAELRADELVTEKPEDLKPYGLDKPEAHWHFFQGKKEVLDLLIGAAEKGKTGRHYAKLGNGDVVFLLDPKATALALAEYRSRTLWKPLDPNLIERVSFTAGDKSFVLERAGNVWQVAGKPELKLRADVVSDTLAALGGLKAERTVADKDPELKLFGLEPPQLVIEVTMRDDSKRVLQIGRSEGESKRSYARVVGGERGDVFTISEKDGARLVRELADFTAGKGKSPE